jgi:hypothetical protein
MRPPFEPPQKRNPRRLPINQHVFPKRSIERFADADGRVALFDKRRGKVIARSRRRRRHPRWQDRRGRRSRHPLRGTAWRAGHAGEALPDELPEIERARKNLRAADRRTVRGRHGGLCIDRVSPEAAEGGAIALIEEGDRIEIDIPNRKPHLAVSDEELARRHAAIEARGDKAWCSANRKRQISTALGAHAAFATGARGAVRDKALIEKPSGN